MTENFFYNKSTSDFSTYSNLILIDSQIYDSDLFYSSANQNTFVIKYNRVFQNEDIDIHDHRFDNDDNIINPVSDDIATYNHLLKIDKKHYPISIIENNDTTYNNELNMNNIPTVSQKQQLEQLLKSNNFTNLQRLCIISDDTHITDFKEFFDSQPYFISDDLINDQTTFSSNLQFIIDLVKQFNITNLDYLICNSLKQDNWSKYYEIISKNTGVIVGASLNQTGNPNYDGDWVLENTNENIKNVYFTNLIETYNSTLATTTISTSTNVSIRQTVVGAGIDYSVNNSVTWVSVPVGNFPIQINNTASSIINVTLTTDITFNASSGASPLGPGANGYFIMGSSNIIFEGNNKKVTINNITFYLGIIQNGTFTNDGFSNITIQNLGVESAGTVTFVNNNAGWITQGYFSKSAINNLIKNCYSTGDINRNAAIIGYGGISAGSTAYNNGSCTITNCYSTGNINAPSSGGICGSRAGENGGNVTIINCYSTGLIRGTNSGGICGSSAGTDKGNVTIKNCYTIGKIIGEGAGGICGLYAGREYGNLTIINCYTSGHITAERSGGICGQSAGFRGSNLTITNCYTTGDITAERSGGISGQGAGLDNRNVTITNCYSTGDITESAKQAGGICGTQGGQENGNVTITNCYTTGDISAESSGGICGSFAGLDNGNVTITNCYSTGNIFGEGASGICGTQAGQENGTVNITSCYSTGDIIGQDAGGICGSFAGGDPDVPLGTCTVINCFSSGYGSGSNGIFGANQQITATQTFSYSAYGSWSDSIARKTLQNIVPLPNSPVGTVWADSNSNKVNVPYIFASFGSSPYTNPSAILKTGETSQTANVTTGVIYSIIAIAKGNNLNNRPSTYPYITINSKTGAITVSKNNFPVSDVYTLYIYQNLLNGAYTVSTFSLTILPIPDLPIVFRTTDVSAITFINTPVKIKLDAIISRPYLKDKIEFVIKTEPKHGKAILINDIVQYIPNKNYTGSDSFTYYCSIYNINSNISTVNIKILEKC